MKKQLLFTTVIFLLLFNSVFSQTVYITKTGEKYHKENCRYLKKSSYSINLSDAKARGYNACSVCKPSTTVKASSTLITNQTTQNNNVKVSQSNYSVQCAATTKAGNQCKRMTKSTNGNCWQHGGN